MTEHAGPDAGRIGRYATRRVLGSGAFATVWLGRDDELDVPVAIKVLAENWTHNADVRARFVEEARILRRISDPRVVGVHDIGSLPDGRSYFVMDFADGGTLADLIGGVDRRTALELAVEVGRAVQVLHDQQILHRDVKPSNMLLRRRKDRADQLMVADLGTAKALAEASGLTLSAGTPAYMAPEQAHGELPLSPSADVYGVAALTYALVSGRPPFPDEHGLSDVARRDPSRRPASLDEGGPLDALMVDALAFDPARRPSSALDLVDRLEAIGRGQRGADEQSTIAFGVRTGSRPAAATKISAEPAAATRFDRGTDSESGRVMSPNADSTAVPSDPMIPSNPPIPSDPPIPSAATARSGSGAGLSPAGLIALVVLLFVVSALVVWILLGLA